MAFDPSTASIVEDKPIASAFDPSTATPVEIKPFVPKDTSDRSVHNILRTGAETVPSAAAGVAGFGGGMVAAAPVAAVVAPLTGPFAPITAGVIEFAGGLGGAFAASGAAQKVTNWMHEAFAPEDYKQRQIEKAQYPYGTFGAELAVNLAGMSPKTAAEVTGKVLTKPIVQRGVSGGLQATIEAGAEYADTGKVDPLKVAASFAAGTAFPGFNPAGEKIFEAGKKVVGSVLPKKATTTSPPSTDIPLPPPKGATPEEKSIYIEKLKAIKADRDAKAPLEQAAIKNMETGNVELMGPKHDQAKKDAIKDDPNFVEGFVDERGNFHDRKAAVDQAKRAGQLPEDHVLEIPGDGLHSGDLRKVGDKRFEITGEQVAGQPKPPVEDTTPKSREDYKSAISKNEDQRINLELQAEEAASVGNEQRVQEINNKIKSLEQEHGQLNKDIPAVKFNDISAPTWEELHDHLWGAKTVGDAFDKITSSGIGNTEQRLLVKLLNKSEFIRNANLTFKNDYLSYTDSQGKRKKNAAGLYYGDLHGVEIGKEGNIYVLLHEAMHAGTVRLIREGSSAAAKKITQLHKEFLERYEAEYEAKLAKFKIDEPNPTLRELIEFERVNRKQYGLSNVDEFVAEAFTNKEFQKLLASIESKEPSGVISNLLEAFRNYVREGLNIPPGKRTAFDEVMEHGSTLIEDSKQFTARADNAFATPSVVDTTRTDPRDVKSEEEFYKIAADIYEKHGEVDAVRFFEGYQEYQKTWLEPIKETEKFVGTNLNNKLANSRIIHNEASNMKEAITDPARRQAIAEAIDKGDLSGLSPEELVVAKKYESLARDIGERAVEKGVVKGLLEDYVTHIIDWAGAPKGAREEFINAIFGKGGGTDPTMRGMTTESKFGKQRVFKTFADLEAYINEANARIEAAGKSDFRLRIKTKDIAEIYKEYATSMEKAIENKNLVDNLKQIRNVAGETLIKEVNKDNPMPVGWQMMDSPQFAGYAIHPDMVPALKFVFDAGPGDLMKAFGAVSQITKRLNVIGSFFHAKSLMEVISSSQIPIWSAAKEAIVGPAIDKLLGTKISGVTRAVEQYRKGGVGDNVDRWIKEGGLQLEVPEDVSKGILSATGKLADQLIGKFGPKTRVLEKSLSTVEKYTLGYFDKFTWDFLHTGGKIMVADARLDQARRQAAEQGRPFDEAAARKEIARFVNDSFGGLNWFDVAAQTQNEFAKRMAMAAYNPAGRRGLQVALFAPDWTISTIRAFTAALPKGLNPTKWHPVEGISGMMTPTTKADYARLYQFKTALTYLTLLNAINMMTANRPIWENKDPTRIEWPDGTSMQAMKHAMEPYHWISDPDKTLANKLGFIPKAVIVGVGGLEYASPQAEKLVDRSATGRLEAVAKIALPFQVAAGTDAPEGEGVKRAVLGTMGFPIYGKTPEQRKAAKAERAKALKEAAAKYHQKAKEKGWEK